MQCKTCLNSYQLNEQEKAICKQLDFPEPENCYECSWRNQFAFRNDSFLYKRRCDFSGKHLISQYAPDAFCPVYEWSLWHSDKWDAENFGRDFDPKRPFFEQFHELQKQVPRPHKISLGQLENSEYTNAVTQLKNCYMVFSAGMNENCYYGEFCDNSNDSMELTNTMKSELCYEGVNSEQCYRCFFIYESKKCSNSAFLLNCTNCQDCFACVNLKNKRYHWLNQPLSKEEYEKKLRRFNFGSFTEVQNMRNKFKKFVLSQPHLYSHSRSAEDSSGDYLYNCKNCTNAYINHNSENCTNIFHCTFMKDSVRCSSCDYIEIGYEVTMCSDYPNPMYDMAFNVNIFGKSASLRYCDYCVGCRDCFGCVGLRNKQYCILNKQYTQDEYEKLRSTIIKHMKKTDEWGKFFPPYCSPFGYNETYAQNFYPLQKSEALQKGFRWQDKTPAVSGKETMNAEDIPDNIADVQESIINEIFVCGSCGKNYKIIKQEYEFYKKYILPPPRLCFRCRHEARLRLRNPMKLHKRQCACQQNHASHRTKRCQNTFETTYGPQRPEKIFCHPCYNQEV